MLGFTRISVALLAQALLLLLGAPQQAAAQDTTQWLMQRSNVDGSIATPNDVANASQSTAEAVRSLRLLGHPAPAVTAGEGYVVGQQYSGTENLTRSILVNVERGAPTQLLTTELLTRQNADGGYGELAGYHSAPLDTAFALNALVRAGQLTTSQNLAALSYLISTQARAAT